MNNIPRVGLMNVFNEDEFIEYSIRSVIGVLDHLIVIYGWFAETKRGTNELTFDKTGEILDKLAEEFDGKIHVAMCSGLPQLTSRNTFFMEVKDLGLDEYWLWIIDGDEVYDAHNLGRVLEILASTKAEGIKLNSYTFVNDFRHYVGIAFPRIFRIQPGNIYNFVAPNDISCCGRPMKVTNYEASAAFFHYSYCKSAERFMLKKREREALPGGRFKWYLDNNNRVTADGVNIRVFDGRHPEVMASHPRFVELGGKA